MSHPVCSFSSRSYLSIAILLSALVITATACASPAPKLMETPAPTNTALRISTSTPWPTNTPILKVAAVTATDPSMPTQTSPPIQPEPLPKLSEVIVSSIDIENDDGLDWNPLVLASDATNELRDSCLWDCAKYRYSLEEGTLTITLLRAGDPQKAKNTVENLRKDFLKTVGYEYTANDLPTMPSNSWVLVSAPSRTKDFLTSAAGIAHGSVVILVTNSQVFCEYTPDFGRYCEGDVTGLVDTSVYFLNMQVKKLEVAGYSK